MRSVTNAFGNSGELNDQVDETGYRKFDIHEGILFCIELSETMFKESSDLEYKSPLLEILESLDELMSQLVITRPGTAIGCYFYYCNREDAKEGIYELFPLRDINATFMKKLNDLLEDLSSGRISLYDYFMFQQTGSEKQVRLSVLFTFMLDTFLEEIPGQKQLSNKRVFLFTDIDKPQEAQDIDERARLRRLTIDLFDNKVNFATFFIGYADKPFDNEFYSDILQLGSHTNENTGLDSEFDGPSTKPIDAKYIKSRILRKKEVKRIMFQCPLILDEKTNFIVGVKGYTMYTHEKAGVRYKLVYEHEDIRQEAYSKRKFLNPITGEDVTGKTVKVYPYGDLDINLSDSQDQIVMEAYTQKDAFLKIIGFRSSSKSIHYFNNIDKSSFIVPDEAKYEGSIRTLASLLKILRKKDKIAILWGKLKSNSHPSLYTLSPSSVKDYNEGFYLYRVPFLDEIRKFPSLLSYDDGSEHKLDYDNMKKVTQSIMGYFNLRDGYNPSDFKNPLLQKHYKVLHDYLLQIETTFDENETPNTKKDRMMREDDSLRKLYYIRNKILESEKSEDPIIQRLNKYVKIWNMFYKKFNDDNISIKEEKKAFDKKPKFNI
ncbi:BTE_collapsed_G0043910.mRNA.1.CDS.1 [Saccharomyces cerevisiae]|uniref:ATP-dependent DNA helicase II subunit 1 n=1 Tax=Saccharomyces pastorianus TaxID=27292 RepID=A0A6C1DYT7_SACPS|nr:Yku70p [Saccharomyces cerevisiae YJM1355]AJS99660.1 Yku70p [Saccharomyces cerevisiae YJM1549]QID81793.1 ATP-dependent DNA helicase yku70 [Saccharomyces pastorianus]CAI4915653.1 BTE_HP_G0217880.mRNA.1.CDS.1 [Saccharomyces cerevisiae]CAI5017364.1 BTE_HP_G0072320.mRNA.1.CDS.1 [Saccharomyces cerevisiae]